MHSYTMHLVKAVYNEEIFRLYEKYEQAIHGKTRTRLEFENFYCNCPLYDPENESERA